WIQSGNKTYFIHTNVDQSSLTLTPQHFDALQDHEITSMNRSADGVFWLGSRHQGLFQWSPNFKPFKVHKKILNQSIFDCGLLEDAHGNILISKQSGIITYDPVTDKFYENPRLRDLPSGMLAQDK